LIDIQESISNIGEFTKNIDSIYDYEQSLLIRRAVERELEIIGEAMNRILRIDPEIAIKNPRRIIDLRNRVIHGYDKVDDRIIWSVITEHLPILKQEVELIIEHKK